MPVNNVIWNIITVLIKKKKSPVCGVKDHVLAEFFGEKISVTLSLVAETCRFHRGGGSQLEIHV